jgi:hypothetical protein
MSMRSRIGLAVVAVIVAVGVWASAQVLPAPVDPPFVVSGADLGFRVTARKGSTPVGSIVVKVNGQWVTAQLGSAMSELDR